MIVRLESTSPAVAWLGRNKRKLAVYLTGALLGALLLSLTFGRSQQNDAFKKQRGAPRKTRDTDKQRQELKQAADPFANRPRISTRNGHLVIEASQDKNVEFKTSGSRGTVTLNGHKIDQLLNVAKALERASAINGGGATNASLYSVAGATGDQFELVLASLFGSARQVGELRKSQESLQKLVEELKRKHTQLSRRFDKRVNQLIKLSKQQENLATKLKQNNCFDQETGQPVCRNGATCVDLYDSFKCICPDSYEGKTCEDDVDECAKFRGTDLGCQNGAKCVNLPGGYKCDCPPRFHGVHCTSLHDDCTLSSSASLCGHGKCVNLARVSADRPNYECICEQGWASDSSSPACVIDIDECLAGQLLAAANSTAALVGPPAPAAAYPCSQNPFVECINLAGSFRCGPCPAGYAGNGRVCRDINECELDNGGCSQAPQVECINLPGTRRCGPCPPGYSGDGFTCSPVSPCQALPNGGCHPMARCVEALGVANADGQRLCVCQYPFEGSGVGVAGCKLVGVASGQQQQNGRDNGTSSAARLPDQKQDDCSPSPCLNGAECRRTQNGFECLCAAGFSGQLCEQADEDSLVCGGLLTGSTSGKFSFPVGSSFERLKTKLLSKSSSQAAGVMQRGDGGRVATATLDEPQLRCVWSISVSTKFAVKLKFSNLENSLEPRRKSIQVQVFDQKSRANPLACSEFLDARERLDSELEQIGARGRLLARLCRTSAGPTSGGGAPVAAASSEFELTSDSNLVDLEYSFVARQTSRELSEPALKFSVAWQQVEPPCGGQLGPAESGSVSSPKFPEFYSAGIECRWLIEAPQGKRLRVQFGELTLLSAPSRAPSGGGECADSLILLDGSIGIERPILFKFCANNQTSLGAASAAALRLHEQGPALAQAATITSSSSRIELVLSSRADSSAPPMRPKQRRGFYLTYAAEPATPLCGGLYSAKAATVKSADYVSRANQLDDSSLAFEFSRYFDAKDNHANYFGSLLPSSPFRWWRQMEHRSGTNASGAVRQQDEPAAAAEQTPLAAALSAAANAASKNFLRRCEFEIRPADQTRNQRVQVDWLEMPNEQSLEPTQLSRLSRRIRCSKSRLSIYDSNPAGKSAQEAERAELATFCSGDKFSSSLPQLMPIASSGHALYLVYETSAPLAPTAANGDEDETGGGAATAPNGFKLRYSTICSAVYRQLESTIETELDLDVSECVYHIILPPNNTISLAIEQPTLADQQQMVLPDGSCTAQAILMDGAMPRGKLALANAERQLRTLTHVSGSLADLPQQRGAPTGSNQTTRANDGADLLPQPDADQPAASGNSEAPPDEQVPSYWQLESSLAHDVKEFDACKLPSLGVETTWNHMSLLFRLKPKARSLLSGDSGRSNKLRLKIRYRAESACGGIISEPREGSIRLLATQPIRAIDNYPLTVARYEHLHKFQFTSRCAWILRNEPNQQIQLSFDSAPHAEIARRHSDWLAWRRKGRQTLSTNSTTSPSLTEFELSDEEAYSFSNDKEDKTRELNPNCAQQFVEAIELYEPALNRTRLLCPTDLLDTPKLHWTTQSDTVFVRLLNSSSEGNSQSNNETWLGRKPLLGFGALVLNYKLLAKRDFTSCGGRLLQSSGLIQSPRFPFSYPPNLNCVWQLVAPLPNQQIRLNFTRFEMEPQLKCWSDFLELRNGPNERSPLIGRFCNSELQGKVLISHSSSLYMRFVSDSHLQRQGFQVHFDGAQTGCGGLLTASSGQIDSPNYPYAYAHSADCEWTIEVSKGNKIALYVQDLDLTFDGSGGRGGAAANKSCKLTGPDASYLELFDSDKSARSLGGRVCRDERKLEPVRSSSNKLHLVYKSQALDLGRGFRLTYATNCSFVELVGFGGVLESPGYPENYPPDSHCSWAIRAPLGSNLTLALTDLEVEEYGSPYGEPTRKTTAPTNRLKTSNAASVPGKRLRTCPNDQLRVWLATSNSTNVADRLTWPGWTNGTQIRELLDRKLDGSWENLHKLVSGATFNFSTFAYKIENIFCGTAQALDDSERTFSLPTNMAIVQFESDSSLEGRGFRFEWRASAACGGVITFNENRIDHFESIQFDELTSLSKWQSARPIECVWTIDASKSNFRLIELDIVGDLSFSTCNESSLAVYDGLEYRTVLSKSCNERHVRKLVFVSNGQAIVRYYSSGVASRQKQTIGNNFRIMLFPNRHGRECPPSILQVNNQQFNKLAGEYKSPSYPDLYDLKSYTCESSISSRRGRLRVSLDELDIQPNLDAGGSSDSSESPGVGLPSASNCTSSGSYLKLRAGYSGDAPSETYCGKFDKSAAAAYLQDKRVGEFVADKRTIVVEFRTRADIQHGGKWKFSYAQLCGEKIQVASPEDYATQNYPLAPDWPETSLTPQRIRTESEANSENVCLWHFRGDPQERLKLGLIDFVESPRQKDGSWPSDCLRVYEGVEIPLNQYNFNLTDLDLKYEPKLKICKRNSLKHSSFGYASRGSDLTVLVSGQTIAKFRVEPFSNSCGGQFLLDAAEFASPDFPQPYEDNLDCLYYISAVPGARIALSFPQFDLAVEGGTQTAAAISNSGDKCDNSDYVEVYQRSASRELELRQRKKFGSSSANVTEFFEQRHLNTSGLLGLGTPLEAVSRLFQLAKLNSLADQEASSSSRWLSAVSSTRSRDFFSIATLVGRFCGKRAPNLAAYDLYDEVLVRFRSHSVAATATNDGDANDDDTTGDASTAQPPRAASATGARGFLASYKLEYGGTIRLVNDGDKLVGGEFIASPYFPHLIRSNSSLKWVFETRADLVFQFDLVSLKLAQSANQSDCETDALSVFEGASANAASLKRLVRFCGYLNFNQMNERLERIASNNWKLPPTFAGLANVAGGRQPTSPGVGKLRLSRLIVHEAPTSQLRADLLRPVRTSSNVATVVYDNLASEGAFMLRYKTVAKQEAPPLEQLSESADGDSDDEDSLALKPIDEVEALREQFGASQADKSCSQLYEIGTGHSNRKANLSERVELRSPNWPLEPSAGAAFECRWLLFSHENSNIQLQIDPSSSVLAYDADDEVAGEHNRPEWSRRDDCAQTVGGANRNLVVVYDGASQLAPVIGRYCLPAPPTHITSSGRHMLVRYVRGGGATGQPAPTRSALFRAFAHAPKCGGQFYAGRSYLILKDRTSKSAKTNYENNLDCMFYLFAAKSDQVLSIGLANEFELSDKPTNKDCSVGDYIEIRDLLVQSDQFDFARGDTTTGSGRRLLGRFCAGKPLTGFESPGSAITIKFHTDNENTAKGWTLFVVSQPARRVCPPSSVSLTGSSPYALLLSPNWPHGFVGRRRCTYNLEAPLGQALEVAFVRMRRQVQAGSQQSLAAALETGQLKCNDSISFVSDIEAFVDRIHVRSRESLREINARSSNDQLRKLVEQVPCNLKLARYYTVPRDDSALIGQLASVQNTDRPSNSQKQSSYSDESSGDGNGGVRTSVLLLNSAEDYFSIARFAPPENRQYIIKSSLNVLTLEFDAKDLLPGEGFVAIAKLVDQTSGQKCSGTISAENGVAGANLLESARFGEQMNETEPFVNCLWKLNTRTTGYESSVTSSKEFELSYSRHDVGGKFFTSFLVFQTLEVPPSGRAATNQTQVKFGQTGGTSSAAQRVSDACGLNRLALLSSEYFLYSFDMACGYLSEKQRWVFIDEGSNLVSLRTKNLRQQTGGGQETRLFRGMRAFFYEKSCAKAEYPQSKTVRIRSHEEFEARNSSRSYSPGICKWLVRLIPGHYELSFKAMNLRPANGLNSTSSLPGNNQSATSNLCDVDSNPELDYVEVRNSWDVDGSFIARFCVQNQLNELKHHMELESSGGITIVFVAGLKQLSQGSDKFPEQLREVEFDGGDQTNKSAAPNGTNADKQFGFDLLISHVKNSTKNRFCEFNFDNSIYNFIVRRDEINFFKDGYFGTDLRANFLYPKNVHCEVELSAGNEEGKLNLTFTNLFDLESSKDCQNDYVQLDDLILAPQQEASQTTTRTTLKPITTTKATNRGQKSKSQTSGKATTLATPTSNTTQSSPQIVPLYYKPREHKYVARRIGRWCGRSLPKGVFLSQTDKVRVTFHSNERIEGKGFTLNWSKV